MWTGVKFEFHSLSPSPSVIFFYESCILVSLTNVRMLTTSEFVFPIHLFLLDSRHSSNCLICASIWLSRKHPALSIFHNDTLVLPSLGAHLTPALGKPLILGPAPRPPTPPLIYYWSQRFCDLLRSVSSSTVYRFA